MNFFNLLKTVSFLSLLLAFISTTSCTRNQEEAAEETMEEPTVEEAVVEEPVAEEEPPAEEPTTEETTDTTEGAENKEEVEEKTE